MTASEQAARKALKQERNALQRQITLGQFPAVSAGLPTRWNHARRGRAIARGYDRESRTLRERIASLDRIIREHFPNADPQ